MTMQQLFSEGSEVLTRAGVPDAALDARYLLLEAFSLSFASFLMVKNQDLKEDEETAANVSRYRWLTAQRAGRVPLQHLMHVQEFMGFPFMVNEHVLIPRQDTEVLVELVLKEQTDKNISLLDMCTGSGCIAVSLALMGGYNQVTALDISKEALLVARENGRQLLGDCGGRLTFLESDMFSGLKEGERFDVIVSNPPYIPTAVIETLEPEVRDFEPRGALDGEADGLKFYRILAEGCGRYLKKRGAVYMEIGCEQAADVRALFEAAGFEELKVIKDMAGLDRVVRASWNKPWKD